jgi:hypothetical protein
MSTRKFCPSFGFARICCSDGRRAAHLRLRVRTLSACRFCCTKLILADPNFPMQPMRRHC